MTGLDIKRDAIMIDIACNDPDSGVFAGVAEQICVGHEVLELELCGRRSPKFAELGNAIKLSRRTWPIIGSKDWVGNWCWNGYWMKIADAVRFLDWLHSTGIYHCTCGEERLFNTWNAPVRFSQEDRDFLWRYLGKPSTHLAA